ncbi:CHAT domain-containing protein [Streptomyces sp. NPDC052101]|uniref:CHAT domain-containing protein n=1 Tax=Streptomyces sp. NPDC052101 TaxID=3155763 RepID=UPI003413E025
MTTTHGNPGSFGDLLLSKVREDPDLAGFFQRNLAHDTASWEPWLAGTAPDFREPVIIAAQALSICYRDRDHDLGQAAFWAETQLRLTRTLPATFDPRQSRLGYGKDQHVAVALRGFARVETMRGAVEHAYSLLRDAERHFLAEEEVRHRKGITERPLAERILGAGGDFRDDLYTQLAHLAWQVGDENGAQHYSDLAIAHRNDDPSAYGEIEELILRGRFHLDSDRPNVALDHFQRAASLAESAETQMYVAELRSNAYCYLAEAYGRLGTPRTALATLDRARALFADETAPKRNRLARVEVSAAHVLRRHPGLGDPMAHLLQALEYCSLPAEPGDPHTWTTTDGRRLRVAAPADAWPILLEAAEILEERGHLTDLCALLRVATGIAEEVRAGAVDEASRIAVQEQRGQTLVALARAQLALARETDAPQHADAAWRTLETLRARTFLDMVGDAVLTPPRGVPADLAEREAELLERRRTLRAAPGRDSGFWAAHRAVERQLADVWRDMAAGSPDAAPYVAARQARPTSHAEVAALLRAAPPGPGGRVVAVNMLFLDDERLALLAVAGADRHVRVATARVDRTRLARFAAANFGSAARVRELATDMEDLFQHELAGVVAPLADLCEPGDTVVLCPAGPVHNVPLGAVRLGQDVLLARNPLVLSPSASLLRSRRLVERRSAGRTYAVFGDPTGDLAGARREAAELARRWGVRSRIGARATAGALLEALATDGTVHVAAHAAFTAGDPLASGIRMADRLLSAREILGVRASGPDLVTLSACESGVYAADRSEDPMGLLRALLFAGAHSVVVSLWKVPDTSAYRLMTAFYRALDHAGSKAHALREAALALREENDRFDRWAAFTLAGSWL